MGASLEQENLKLNILVNLVPLLRNSGPQPLQPRNQFKVRRFKFRRFKVRRLKVRKFKVRRFKVRRFKVRRFKVRGFKFKWFKVTNRLDNN